MSPEGFRVEIPQARLDELHRRLDQTNWPHDFDNEDWEYGVPASYLREVVAYWRDGFDWRAQEAAMNAFSHFRVEIDAVIDPVDTRQVIIRALASAERSAR